MTEPKMVYLVDQYDRVPVPTHVLARLLKTAAETLERLPAEADWRMERVTALSLLNVLKTLAYGHAEEDVKEWAAATADTLTRMVRYDDGRETCPGAGATAVFPADLPGNQVGNPPGRGPAGQPAVDGPRNEVPR